MSRPKKINLQPASGYVLVKPEEVEKKTASGIVLPDIHEEKPQKGQVISLGDPEITESGQKKEAPCKKGDVVIYKKWGGNELEINGVEYMFLRFEDILAIEK